MRIVHARKKVFITDYAFENKFVLLTWVLSILKWKEYGNEIVLYTDIETYSKIKKMGFAYLYDEVNTQLLEEGPQCENIDFRWFWAMPKIVALHYESFHLNNEVVIADMDVVPMSDLSRFWVNAPVCVWSNKEYLEFTSTYPEIYTLSLPKDYKLPEWFTGKSKPLNTGVLHFKKQEIANEYCEEVFKYVRNNTNDKDNTDCITMCNAEQRMLAEFLNHKQLSYQTIQPINEGLFNKNAFHTHGYKSVLNNDNALQWNCSLLKMIRELDQKMFLVLLDKELFKEEKEYFYSGKASLLSYTKELQKYFK